MSTYREPKQYVEQAVESILNQTYKDIELIIIVDDPDNMEVIRYIRSKKQDDHRIILRINEKNCGIVESLNRGILLAKGEYIARMDADDISELDRLEKELEYLISNNFDLVGCNVRNMDENSNIINMKGSHYPTSDETIKKYLKMGNAVPHPTWLIKKNVFESTHLYRDFPACEDYEFLTRIALDKKRLGNLKEPKLRYRINRNGISCSKKVLQKTSLYYIRRNYAKEKKSDIIKFQSFLQSAEGIRKAKRIEQYYKQSAKLKQYFIDKRWVSFFLLGIGVFIRSEEARHMVIFVLKEHILRLYYGRQY